MSPQRESDDPGKGEFFNVPAEMGMVTGPGRETKYLLNVAPNTKPSNPKDLLGSDRVPLSLWPMTATVLGAMALTEGMVKYGRANFRAVGVRASIYLDACLRHLAQWDDGEEIDPDSGLPHLGKALACLAILVDAQACGKLVDDRSFNGGGVRKLLREMTPHVARLRQQHADKTPKHYCIQDNEAEAA